MWPKSKSTSKSRDGFARRLLLAFGAVALVFVACTLYVNRRGHAIEARTEALVDNALPSVEHLTRACDVLEELEAASDDYVSRAPTDIPAAREAIERKWREVDAELSTYASLPAFPGEHELYRTKVPAALREVNASLTRLFTRVEANDFTAAHVIAHGELRVATNLAGKHLRELVLFEAAHAYGEVNALVETRRSIESESIVLDALAILFGAAAGFWTLCLFRIHDRFLVAHAALVAERADELELFGKRVAHDLLSPLSAMTSRSAPSSASARATRSSSPRSPAGARASSARGAWSTGSSSSPAPAPIRIRAAARPSARSSSRSWRTRARPIRSTRSRSSPSTIASSPAAPAC